MPRPRALGSSTQRRHKRADFLSRTGVFTMRPCSSCTSFGVACILSAADERCEQCFRHNRVCELASRQAEAERVLRKKDELREQRWEAERKVVRLRKQERLLQKRLRELSKQEEQNIEEMEADEAAADAAVAALSPRRVVSPGPTSPTGLSQVSFGSFGRTSPVPTGS
jgi:TolA-binding protein